MKFSILMCVYNEEKFIGSALENVIKQVRKYHAGAEILVGIDGGNDRTDEIARSFKKKFKRLMVHKFAQNKDRTRTLNWLIGKTKGEIIIINDGDRLLNTDLNKVEKIFDDKKVGALIGLDVRNRDFFNEGQRIFEDTYMQVKLDRYTRGNIATVPEFDSWIYRKAALGKPPRFDTIIDDREAVYRAMKNGYKAVYSKDVAYAMPDNPLQPKLKASDIMKRRVRSAVFKYHAKNTLNTELYSSKSHLKDFTKAIFLTLGKCSPGELLSFLKYLAIMFVAIVSARIRFQLKGAGFGSWNVKYRVTR